MKTIYLDYAAATPIDERVAKVVTQLQKELFYNPSATYEPARLAKQKIEEAKKSIAHNLGARSSEIVLTSGGSESNNLAIRGVMEAHPGSKILVSAIEHEAVLEPARMFDQQMIAVDKNGLVDVSKISDQIDDDVVLISLIHASNEIGTIQPLKEVATVIREVRLDRAKRKIDLPIYLHTDACQTAGILDVHVHSLGVDMLSLNGGKIYGPPETGALFVGSNVVLKPQILGGNQQRGMRSGTLSAGLSSGLALALDIAQSMREKEAQRLRDLQRKFIAGIEKKFPDAKINGSLKKRSPTNLNVSFPGQNNEVLLLKLEKEGILASAGAACAAASNQPSHVLEALGLPSADIEGSIRISLGRFTTEDDIDTVLSAILKCTE